MHRVNINTDCNTLLLSACYLWKSTRVHGVSVADSPVVLQQSLWEDDRGEGLHRNKRWCMCISVCGCVCARALVSVRVCVEGCVCGRGREGFFLCEPKCLTGSFALKTLTIGRLGKFG